MYRSNIDVQLRRVTIQGPHTLLPFHAGKDQTWRNKFQAKPSTVHSIQLDLMLEQQGIIHNLRNLQKQSADKNTKNQLHLYKDTHNTGDTR
jgi:hypothetical protein